MRCDTPQLFGSPLSPYSMKVRAYLAYKRIPFRWTVRTAANMGEFNRHARVPLVPLWLPCDAPAIQDSTLIIDHLERLQPLPPAMPTDGAIAFIGWLIEEYADEWGNRLLAYFRWVYDVEVTCERTIRMRWPDADPGTVARETALLRTQRVPKILEVAGANSANAQAFEASLETLARLLDLHLANHEWLLGPSPCVADFALAGQLQQCINDPTAGARLAVFPHLVRWAHAAMEPTAPSACEPLTDGIPETLIKLLREEVGPVLLSWEVPNARGHGVQTTIHGCAFALPHQRYSAKSMRSLARRLLDLKPDARAKVEEFLRVCDLQALTSELTSMNMQDD